MLTKRLMRQVPSADEPQAKTVGVKSVPHEFIVLTLTMALSKLGNQMLYLAVPWAVIRATGSARLAALSLAAQAAPYFLAPLLGAVIDTFNQRRIYITSLVLQSILVGCLPFLVSPDKPQFLVGAYFILVALGICSVVENIVSDYVIVPQIVSSSALDRANGIYQGAIQVGRLLGPAVGGVVIGLYGPSTALWIDALTFLAPISLIMRMQVRSRVTNRSGSLGQFFFEGLTNVLSSRPLKQLCVTLLVFNLGVGGLSTFLVTMGAVWKISANRIGLYLTLAGASSAIGSWYSSHGRLQINIGHKVQVWLLVCSLGIIPMISQLTSLVFPGYALFSLGLGALNVTTITLRQRIIDPRMAGRANSIIRMLVMGAIPVSTLVLTQLYTAFGFVPTVQFSLALSALASLIWMVSSRLLDSEVIRSV